MFRPAWDYAGISLRGFTPRSISTESRGTVSDFWKIAPRRGRRPAPGGGGREDPQVEPGARLAERVAYSPGGRGQAALAARSPSGHACGTVDGVETGVLALLMWRGPAPRLPIPSE